MSHQPGYYSNDDEDGSKQPIISSKSITKSKPYLSINASLQSNPAYVPLSSPNQPSDHDEGYVVESDGAYVIENSAASHEVQKNRKRWTNPSTTSTSETHTYIYPNDLMIRPQQPAVAASCSQAIAYPENTCLPMAKCALVFSIVTATIFFMQCFLPSLCFVIPAIVSAKCVSTCVHLIQLKYSPIYMDSS